MNYIIFVENYIYLEGTSKQMPLSKKCALKKHTHAPVSRIGPVFTVPKNYNLLFDLTRSPDFLIKIVCMLCISRIQSFSNGLITLGKSKF